MTIDEVIKELKIEYLGDSEKMKQAKDVAVKALEELQAYREAWRKVKRTVKAYLMLEGVGSAYQDDIENLIEGCIPKDRGAE